MKKILIEFFNKNKINILILLIFVAINMYIATIPSEILGNIVDLLENINANRVQVINLVFILMGVSVLLLIVRLIWKYVDILIPRSLEKLIRENLFEHFLNMDISKIHNIKNGELMSYFVKDISEIRIAGHHLFSFGSRIIFTFVFAIIAMAKNVDLKLTFISLIPIFVATIIISILRIYIDKTYKVSQEKFTDMSEFLQEATDSIRTTKAYQLEDKQIELFKNNYPPA